MRNGRDGGMWKGAGVVLSRSQNGVLYAAATTAHARQRRSFFLCSPPPQLCRHVCARAPSQQQKNNQLGTPTATMRAPARRSPTLGKNAFWTSKPTASRACACRAKKPQAIPANPLPTCGCARRHPTGAAPACAMLRTGATATNTRTTIVTCSMVGSGRRSTPPPSPSCQPSRSTASGTCATSRRWAATRPSRPS